jgi:hypothetical protein
MAPGGNAAVARQIVMGNKKGPMTPAQKIQYDNTLANLGGRASRAQKRSGPKSAAVSTSQRVQAPSTYGAVSRAPRSGITRINKRDLIDIAYQSSTAFDVIYEVAIQPGLAEFTSWLAPMANRHTRYRFKRAAFEFISANPTTLAGTFAAVVDYNGIDGAPTGLFQMLAGANSTEWPVWQPSVKMPLDQKFLNEWRYCRSDDLPANQDIKTYDVGILYLASNGAAAGANTRIWFDYEIEFETPVLPSDDSDAALVSGSIENTGSTSLTQPFGTAPVYSGILNYDSGLGDGLKVYIRDAGEYILNYFFTGTALSGATPTVATGTGATASNPFLVVNAPANAATYSTTLQTTLPDTWVSVTLAGATTIAANMAISSFKRSFYP